MRPAGTIQVTSAHDVSDKMLLLTSVPDLVAYAAALGAADVSGLTCLEEKLVNAHRFKGVPPDTEWISDQILSGQDPLGDTLCAIRTQKERRDTGAVYTPPALVRAMTEWAARACTPDRVVDPGSGSGRFLLAAGRLFPKATLVGFDLDPVATLLARANLAAAGFADRSDVRVADYRDAEIPAVRGRTLFIGNPPYVRHHLISSDWKAWFSSSVGKYGLRASTLAGLHVHFFIATLCHARPGDLGAFVTAAEWLDVNYGHVLRELFLYGLGGQSITLVAPEARPFPDAATTAAITTFCIGEEHESVRLRRVSSLADLGALGTGNEVSVERLKSESRWTGLSRLKREVPSGFVELGEICRVHRGQVTGNNGVWIAGDHSNGLPPRFLFPTVTRARELFSAPAGLLTEVSQLRSVIDLPTELDGLSCEDRRAVDRFLRWARSIGANRGYVTSNRKAWWAVGLRPPPVILATYMARRPPAFVGNVARARHINIAHGLYPRVELSALAIARLRIHLSSHAAGARGRMYAGGLMKFEPREMERIIVPGPQLLERSDGY